MTIDLKWGLPVAMPFAVVIMARAITAFIGMDWHEDVEAGLVAALALTVGPLVGVLVAAALEDGNVKWTVRIGK